MKLVSIITVNFNQPLVTEELLESVRAHNDYPAVEVIVVDNGSTVDPTAAWRAKYPHHTFIRSEENLGFAGGNNLGIAAARGEYFFLINNDTEVTPGLVGALSGTLDANERIGIVSPKIHYASSPGLIQYAGYTPMRFVTGRNRSVGQFEVDRGQYDNASGATGYVHGAAMMVRREAVERAGRMDENYFLYYEELDWAERIRRAGYELHTNLNALIHHKESVSVGKRSALKEYFMTRNRILFVRKHASVPKFALFCTYYGLVVVPRNLFNYLRHREYRFIPVFLRAIGWHFTHPAHSSDLGYPV